jgi:enamine deaminase RidA (YjgF/YER057c/UK114 family)
MMTARKNVSSASPYEPVIGFSRAVQIGNIIAVGGTGPIGPDGMTVGAGDVASQARRCFEISMEALDKLGAGPADIIRTRMMLTRIEDWEAVAQVHGEFFREVRPASTIMQVTSLVDPEWLIETEMDAVVG